MRRFALLAPGTLAGLLLALSAAAEEPKEKGAAKAPPAGTWARKVRDNEVRFVFRKEGGATFRLMFPGGDGFAIDADTKTDQEGVTHFTIKEFKPLGSYGGGEPPGKDYSFKLKFDKDTMTLSDLKGEGIEEEQRQLVEGEYKRAED